MLTIKEKFNLLDKLVLDKTYLTNLLQKMPENYSIYDLTRKWVISVIKRNETYLNLAYEKWPTPWTLWAAYCGDIDYMFGWLAVYNLYGFTTQIANKYMIYSSVFYGTREIYNTYITFKKVEKKLLYGYEKKFDRGLFYNIMTRERAFIEYCRENQTKIDQLKSIYRNDIDHKEFVRLLKKYPYNNIQTFIKSRIIQW